MRVITVESTEKFVGPADAPLQLVRVDYTGCAAPTPVRVTGPGLDTPELVPAAPGDGTVEVPVAVTDPVVGGQRRARVQAGTAEREFTFTVAEPGWTMFMVGHFHYDPVWWNTQAGYTSEWTEDPAGACRQTNGITLVRAHLDWAHREPEYKFVLAEVDYLKPYWDTHPQDRAELRALIRAGRVEVVGGTYNEPNATLTDPETTIRSLVHGIGFQRDVLGLGEHGPASAWQLDVFGHDPQFPAMLADAGLTSSAWARGPHHQWGPMADHGDVRRMQFPSEFEWIGPSGGGLLTHYMPAHYAAGWWMDSHETLTDAEDAVYKLFTDLRAVAATRNVLLPVGTDFTPPNRWVVDIHRDWAARYTWPRFVCGLPKEFFAAVRAELATPPARPARGGQLSPQTRDMNPIYTGTYVSYIDTKQANRAAEQALLAAEKFATFAALLTGPTAYPQAALAKAWTQLAYGAHHDSVTGSESDQVYLDLLTGWRDAWQLAVTARDNALAVLSAAVGPGTGTGTAGRAVTVWNPVGHDRTDLVTVVLADAPGAVRVIGVIDTDGTELPCHVDGAAVSWLARDVPSLGWRSYRLLTTETGSETGAETGWEPIAGTRIANEHYRLDVDPDRGGGVSSLRHHDVELIVEGALGNQLAVYDEYPQHPRSGEGPWHLVPSGNLFTSAAATDVTVQAYSGPLGERLVVTGRIRTVLRYTQILTLWGGLDRVDCRTRIDEFTGVDHLVRLRWPCRVPGAMPVAEVADAVIGRGFGVLHEASGRSVDTAQFPWTMETAAHRWFGLSTTARVTVGSETRAVAVAEVIAPADRIAAPRTRGLLVALVRAGVTASCTDADGVRCGDLAVDSNLPDTRIALGGPDRSAFTRQVLAAADPAYTAELNRQLDAGGRARVWVPAATPLARVWAVRAGSIDLRDPAALPVLIVAGRDDDELAAALDALTADLADARIEVDQQAPAGMEPFTDRTVALLNRGVPAFAVDTAGTLHTALLRSCTGWPSATWIDAPRRTAPDGSAFGLQHWTHTFDYALVAGAGDWRETGVVARGAEFNAPLLAVPADGSGELPAGGSLLRVDAAGAVQLAVVKPAGNPLAHGSAGPIDPADLTLRLVEAHGGDARVNVGSDLGAVTLTGRTDLIEAPREHPDPDLLHGFEIATVAARLTVAARPDTGTAAALAPDAEAVQPLYARYWLHNRGPAPLGGLPAVAHLEPREQPVEPGTTVTTRLSVAGDCTDATLSGTVTLAGPPGWSVEPARLPVRLPPRGHVETEVTVGVPAGAAPGRYPVSAQLQLTGAELPASWRQSVEDVAVLSVGAVDGDPAQLVQLDCGPADIEVAPGGTGRLTVVVGSAAEADLTVEAHLISPWGTWEWIGPPTAGAVLPAGGTVELAFAVTPPPGLAPGTWWALIRVGCAGTLLYSPAVQVVVR